MKLSELRVIIAKLSSRVVNASLTSVPISFERKGPVYCLDYNTWIGSLRLVAKQNKILVVSIIQYPKEPKCERMGGRFGVRIRFGAQGT